MKKRILSLALSAAMALTMLPTGAFAASDKGKPPVYNKATGCYEISTPDQLLYLSGSWRDGAPREIHKGGNLGVHPCAHRRGCGDVPAACRQQFQPDLQNEKNFESHLTKTHKWCILQI